MKKNGFKTTDHERFRDFYLTTYHALVGFGNKFLDDPYATEDIVQDSYLKLYNLGKEFAREEEARAWMYVSVRNLCIDYLRRGKFRGGELNDTLVSDSFFLDEITRQEALLALRRSIETLPARTREVALLTCNGMSNNEIASHMGLTVNSVKTLKKEAYKKLRYSLGGECLIILSFLFVQ